MDGWEGLNWWSNTNITFVHIIDIRSTILWTCNTHHYHIQDKSQIWENNRIKTSIQRYEENEHEWFLVIDHKCYVLKKFSNVFLWCNLLFCFTWYDMTYWMCSRHWMWKLITLVWSGKSALPGHLPLQKSGGGGECPLAKWLLTGCAFGPAKFSSKWWLAWSQLEHAVLELNLKPCRRRSN